jgi:hypothetical protein
MGTGQRGGVGVSSLLLATGSAETSTPTRRKGDAVGVLDSFSLTGSAESPTAAPEEAASPPRYLLLPTRLAGGEGLRSEGGGVDVANLPLPTLFTPTPTTAR